VRAVLDLLMHLGTEADEAGGEVIVVLGNHETMSLMANLRHTTPELLSRSTWSDSTSSREAAYNDYLALAADRADAPEPLSRDAWLDAHPPGFLKYLDVFGPDGLYGRWLRSKAFVVRVGDSIFLHGGLHTTVCRLL